MGLTVDLQQALQLEMGIALGRGQRAMTEELLDRSQIGTTLE